MTENSTNNASPPSGTPPLTPVPASDIKPAKLYLMRDYAQNAVHITAAVGLAAGAEYWAGPWHFGICAAASGALIFGGQRLMAAAIPTMFKEYKEKPVDAPELPEIIEELTPRAGLKTKPTLHQFMIHESENSKSDNTMPPQFKRVVNAAAISITKPMVLVSEPLLKLMQPPTRKGVVAHEFAHLGAGHSKTRQLTSWLQATTMFSAVWAMGSVAVSSSWPLTIASYASFFAVAYIGNKLMPKPEDRNTHDGETKPRTRRTQYGIWAAQELVSWGLLASANPVPVLTALGLEHSFFWASNLITRSFDRRQEFQADRGAVKLGADPLALITGLRQMEAALERDEPEMAASRDYHKGPFAERALKRMESLFSTHPNTPRRCKALAKIALKAGRSQEEVNLALTGPVDISGLPPLAVERQRVKLRAELRHRLNQLSKSAEDDPETVDDAPEERESSGRKSLRLLTKLPDQSLMQQQAVKLIEAWKKLSEKGELSPLKARAIAELSPVLAALQALDAPDAKVEPFAFTLQARQPGVGVPKTLLSALDIRLAKRAARRREKAIPEARAFVEKYETFSYSSDSFSAKQRKEVKDDIQRLRKAIGPFYALDIFKGPDERTNPEFRAASTAEWEEKRWENLVSQGSAGVQKRIKHRKKYARFVAEREERERLCELARANSSKQFDQWLDDCRNGKITSEELWKREDRRRQAVKTIERHFTRDAMLEKQALGLSPDALLPESAKALKPRLSARDKKRQERSETEETLHESEENLNQLLDQMTGILQAADTPAQGISGNSPANVENPARKVSEERPWPMAPFAVPPGAAPSEPRGPSL